MTVRYHALGGGHGHALRGMAVLSRLGQGTLIAPARVRAWAESRGVDCVSPPRDDDPAAVRAWVAALPRPRLLIADVFPRGVVGELEPLLGGVPTWLVTRHVRPELYAAPAAREALALMERVLWTEEPPPALAGVGERIEPVLLGGHALSRDEARAELAVPSGAPLLLGIGTGPVERQQRLSALLGKVAARVGAAVIFASDVLPEDASVRRLFPVARWLAGADVVIAAGGYHAFHECRAAGARAVFLPQARPWDDQDWRVRGARVARGPEELEDHVRRALREEPPAPVPAHGADALASAIASRLSA